jgi:diguanylate cyclase (GGDEF)-like protein/PAS domain S-box-containing protein
VTLDSDNQRLQKLFSTVQSMTKVGGWEVDLVNKSLYWTEETYRIHDTTPEEYTPELATAIKFYAPEWMPVITSAIEKATQDGSGYNLELELITAKGRRIWVHTYAEISMQAGKAIRVTGAFQDITDKKLAEQEIWKQGNFDFLTGLPNRRLFRDRLEQELKKNQRTGKSLAVLFIDLDRFKEINDTFGHDQGDKIIKEAAQRLSGVIRKSDTLARLGGDEFTVVISELDNCQSVERIADNIIDVFKTPFEIGKEQTFLSASIGITFSPEDEIESDGLLKNADQAMYEAKKQGRNGYCYYTKELQSEALARGVIINNLRGAQGNNEFHVVYQPIVDLQTGDINKAEALIRWIHPTRGFINPADFIKVAEETGLILDIGEWVFQQVTEKILEWRRDINPQLQISVNTSPAQYHDKERRLSKWFDYLKDRDLPGEALVVEITEGILMDSHTPILQQLTELRQSGIQISLDDFGTGFSSLSYLRKFATDYVKIDRSFVTNLKTNSRDMALCEAIIAMAHKLGISVVAEGIETQEQQQLLIQAGCDFGQGYFFSKPVKADEFASLLRDSMMIE